MTVPSVLVMGVSGSGKSTIGAALATRLGAAFQDGDDLHPPANIEKMRSGHALTDADRAPWLAACGRWLSDRQAEGTPAVLACSALKRSYRDAMRAVAPDLRVVYLEGSAGVLGARIAARRHHFFPPSLLDAQLAVLEPPTADEAPTPWTAPITVPVTLAPDVLVDRIEQALAQPDPVA